MSNEIILYLEMCQREGVSLQRGMNFELQGNHSVILMSVRPNAPYADRFDDDGSTLIYEGHDVPRSPQNLNPKAVDQSERTPSGNQTQNGLFYRAARRYAMAGASRNESECMRRSSKASGRTTGYFTWSTHGRSQATVDRFSNSSLSPSRERKTSVSLFPLNRSHVGLFQPG